jgi:hypothetical protein
MFAAIAVLNIPELSQCFPMGIAPRAIPPIKELRSRRMIFAVPAGAAISRLMWLRRAGYSRAMELYSPNYRENFPLVSVLAFMAFAWLSFVSRKQPYSAIALDLSILLGATWLASRRVSGPPVRQE